MADDIFTDPDETREQWADVRMTDPDEGEWDIDVVVAQGRVEYVDLRIKSELLTAFLDCLIEDVGHQRASRILASIAERNELDLSADDTDS